MTLRVNIPDSLLRQTAELAERQQVTVDQVAAALSAQVSAAAARAQRVNWQKVDQILARVPAKPPVPGDER